MLSSQNKEKEKLSMIPKIEYEQRKKGDFFFLEIASEILDLGPSGIKNFIRHLENNTEIVHHARGMIIGWAGAGKTTILKKLLGKNPKKKIKRSTRGVSVHTAIFKLSKGQWIGKIFIIILKNTVII